MSFFVFLFFCFFFVFIFCFSVPSFPSFYIYILVLLIFLFFCLVLFRFSIHFLIRYNSGSFCFSVYLLYILFSNVSLIVSFAFSNSRGILFYHFTFCIFMDLICFRSNIFHFILYINIYIYSLHVCACFCYSVLFRPVLFHTRDTRPVYDSI